MRKEKVDFVPIVDETGRRRVIPMVEFRPGVDWDAVVAKATPWVVLGAIVATITTAAALS